MAFGNMICLEIGICPTFFFFLVLVDRSSVSCLATRPSGQVSAAVFDFCLLAAMSGLLVQVSLGEQGG